MRLLRDFLILPLLRMKFLQRRMFGKLSQLHVSYRGSPLSRDEFNARPWQRRPRKAGDRAPDVAFRLFNSGNTTTLFMLLSKVRPVILIGSGSTDEMKPLMDVLRKTDLDAYFVLPNSQTDFSAQQEPYLLDMHGDFETLYGLRENFFCLIRPDGHIGLVQHPISLSGVTDYLKLICPDQPKVNVS